MGTRDLTDWPTVCVPELGGEIDRPRFLDHSFITPARMSSCTTRGFVLWRSYAKGGLEACTGRDGSKCSDRGHEHGLLCDGLQRNVADFLSLAR